MINPANPDSDNPLPKYLYTLYALDQFSVIGYIIVDSVITYTLSIGAVSKPHLPGIESVYLFLKFTIKET